MKISRLTLSSIEIPLRVVFKHASAERTETQSIWVEAHSTSGERGVGEGCPRSYVTGEDIASVREFFVKNRDALMAEIEDLASIRAWVTAHKTEIDQNPAAWCALELALIDLIARSQSRSVESLLGLPELRGRFQYTAVVGDSGIEAFKSAVVRYLEFGFTSFKVKLSGDLKHDRDKLSWLGEHRQVERIRLDANNLWDSVATAADFLQSLDSSIFAVEEPITANRYRDLADLANRIQLPIILDESFLRIEQLNHLEKDRSIWIINLRVSKMGGLMRSLKIADAAATAGIPLIIGAQVGESSLLTRAALVLAYQGTSTVIGREGAFGTLLLEEDVCSPPLMFGPGGKLSLTDGLITPHSGFGLTLQKDMPFNRRIA